MVAVAREDMSEWKCIGGRKGADGGGLNADDGGVSFPPSDDDTLPPRPPHLK